MKRLFPLAPLALFAILFGHGCATAGADPTATNEVRKTDSFHGIFIAGTIEVEARMDASTRVELFADAPAQLADVVTYVKDGNLVFETRPRPGQRGKHDKGKLRAVVSAPLLDTLAIAGTGVLRVKNLSGGTVTASVPGTGVLQLSGKVQQLRLDVAGTGEVKAKDLVAESATVDMSGTAEATVYATSAVDARISGTGAIRIHGRPASIKKSVSGTGIIDVR